MLTVLIILCLVVTVLVAVYFLQEPNFEDDTLWFGQIIKMQGDKVLVEGFNRALTWKEDMPVPEGFKLYHPPDVPYQGMLILRFQTKEVVSVEPNSLEFLERCGNVRKESGDLKPRVCAWIRHGQLHEIQKDEEVSFERLSG